MANGAEVSTSRRKQMVEQQLAARGIGDDRLLRAMGAVPRERFVAPEMVEFAYEDAALPIEAEQTISQPYVVGIMLEALELDPDDRVLEVGAGSGYAAAILSRMVAEVYAIERHRSLVDAARRSLDELGYDNVDVRHGDGTLGWEEEAPFDAILVSAGGPEVPRALEEQLAVGGRLVMPVGEAGRIQQLLVIHKAGDGSLKRRSLGDVRFVPLIGTVAESAPDEGEEPTRATESERPEGRRRRTALPDRAPDELDVLRGHLEPFESVADADLGTAADRMSGHRVVLFGEASHGTSEFYEIRARLTRELIERGEIDFVAVEADWPDARHLDRFVRGQDDRSGTLEPFSRFPRWMWANEETLEFLFWLRDYNETVPDPDERVGFFGLDLYSLHTSIQAILQYLDDVDPETARLARSRFACLNPWERDPQTYGRLASSGRLEGCEQDVVRMLRDLLDKRSEYVEKDGLRYLDATENARLVANAERYYRIMYQGPTASWNLRDQHMFDVLVNLLTYHGSDASAAVWAHNSHLGDASATDMGARGKHNVGQLCRQRFGRGCYAVGMGTHAGTVMAAHEWGDPGEVMEVRPSLAGSYERLSHDTEASAFFLPMRDTGEVRRVLTRERLERAIGVIYRPETERLSHYFHAALPRQFDEWIFLDRTEAVRPLGRPSEEDLQQDQLPETYPFAV